MFPSTWGCRKEKKIPKMLQTSLPHLRGHLVGGSSFSSRPQRKPKRGLLERNASGNEVLRLKIDLLRVVPTSTPC